MYTDSVNDNGYESNIEDESTVIDNNGGNRNKLIIIGVLAAVLIILIVIIISRGRGGSKNNNYVLSLYPENIIVPLGETVNISYDVRNNGELLQNPTVRLIIENEEIVKLEDTNIKGISYGKTMLIASFVDDNGKTVQELKEVTVADGKPGVNITDVVIAEGDLQMPLSGTYDLRLTIEPQDGYVENKKFTSSNNNVVMVDSNGQITAVGEGEATIIIDINNGAIKKQLKVYVNGNNTTPKLVVSPTKITIGNGVENIIVGNSANLSYVVYPDEASKDNIVWSSSDTSVLTVDENGKITGVKTGEATVKVTTPNNISDSIKIKVQSKEIEVTDINVSTTELYLSTGQSETITPEVLPEDATDKNLSYESSDTSIASVIANGEEATITGVGAGTATITIKSINDVSKTINVTVSASDTPIDSGGYSGGGGSCASCNKVTCGSGQYCNCGKCAACPAGYTCSNGQKTVCPKGSYCNNGSKYSCPSGKTTSGTGAKSASDCKATTCPNGTYVSGSDCPTCPKGYYCYGGNKYACPSGKTTSGTGNSSSGACSVNASSTCPKGQYMGSNNVCLSCSKGYYCADGKTQTKCPSGKTTSGTGAKSSGDCTVSNTISCASG